MHTEPQAPRTIEQVQAAILARSTIEIRTDKKGREFAQYYCRRAMRWIRCSLDAAKIAVAAQASLEA
jgi:hypothetical protein